MQECSLFCLAKGFLFYFDWMQIEKMCCNHILHRERMLHFRRYFYCKKGNIFSYLRCFYFQRSQISMSLVGFQSIHVVCQVAVCKGRGHCGEHLFGALESGFPTYPLIPLPFSCYAQAGRWEARRAPHSYSKDARALVFAKPVMLLSCRSREEKSGPLVMTLKAPKKVI